MSDKKEFVHESVQDTRSISEYLQALIDGFNNGRIYLRSGEKELFLGPNNNLQFSIKAKKKGYKSKITMKIAWKDVTAPPETKEQFHIS